MSVVEPVWFKTNIGQHSVSPKGNQIDDYNTYRKKVNELTQKGLDDAQSPDAVVNTITKLISTKEPKFSNPIGMRCSSHLAVLKGKTAKQTIIERSLKGGQHRRNVSTIFFRGGQHCRNVIKKANFQGWLTLPE